MPVLEEYQAVPGTIVPIGALVTPGGDQGIPGTQGPQGPTGPQGPSGSGTGDMLASVYDTNYNNIVDAAESVPWTGVSGKPATFPSDWNTTTNKPASFAPSAHAATHLSAGSDPIAIATSVLAGLCPAVDNTTIQVVANRLSAVSLAWTAITGKPATFPPDGTAMLKSVYDTNANGVVDTCDLLAWSKVTGTPATFPSDWNTTANKPATFAPSAHQASHVTGTDQIPNASSSQRGLLAQLSGNTTDFVDGTNACQNLVTAVQPTIWSVRLRSYNALAFGNCNFEVDQRNTFSTLTNPATSTFLLDRWIWGKVPAVNTTVSTLTPAAGNSIVVPGTSFCISNRYLRINNQAVVSSPAATDLTYIVQFVEGSIFRELSNDVHSVSLLVRTSLSSLKLGLSIRDSSSTRSLTKLVTITGANTWNLISFANLPLWPSAGTFSLLPGNTAYTLAIALMAGSTFMSPANDTWQTGNFVGALGQDNFCAQAIGTTLDIAFAQHEPGPPTTLQDLDFDTNLLRCERHFQKSYDLGVKPGTVSGVGQIQAYINAGQQPNQIYTPFKRRMAKAPTVTGYSPATGAINNVRDTSGVDRVINSVGSLGETSFAGFNTATTNAANTLYNYHYTADTGM